MPEGNERPALADKSVGWSDDPLPIRMLHDRVLVSTDGEAGERRSSGGIVVRG